MTALRDELKTILSAALLRGSRTSSAAPSTSSPPPRSAIPTCAPTSTATASSFMPHDPRAWLWDAREAADAIAEFTAGMDAEAYAGSRLVRTTVAAMLDEFGPPGA